MRIQDTPQVTRDSDKFQLRLPQGMRQEIAQQAQQNGRSINAEMIARLRMSFDLDGLGGVTLEKRQNEIIAFLCECIEQLITIEVSSEKDQQKVDTIIALYRSMVSGNDTA